MTPKILHYYEWDDIQVELCKNLNIPETQFRSMSRDDCFRGDCWHVWLSLWGDRVRNDLFDSVWFFPSDEKGDKDGEWGYLEEQAVKEYGEWARAFVKAVEKLVIDHLLANKETIIHYSW